MELRMNLNGEEVRDSGICQVGRNQWFVSLASLTFDIYTKITPQIVSSILVGAMFFTRRREYRILPNNQDRYGLLGEEPDSARSSDELLQRDDTSDFSIDSTASTKDAPKKRWCCGLLIYTPNTSRFASHFHSRIMQKFPFF